MFHFEQLQTDRDFEVKADALDQKRIDIKGKFPFKLCYMQKFKSYTLLDENWRTIKESLRRQKCKDTAKKCMFIE